MKPGIVIDCFAEHGLRYRAGYAVIAIDVIRATTVAISAVAAGWRCFPVASPEQAVSLASAMRDPLLMGELSGDMPECFEMNNSPAELASRSDRHRPIVLLSSNGTKLIAEAAACDVTYVACLRNFRAAARHVVGKHERVAIVGAGSRGEFREEDAMCCAWIGEFLTARGYTHEDSLTAEIISKWSGAPATGFIASRSVDYLRRTNQLQDLDYVLQHVDDLDSAYVMDRGELVPCRQSKPITMDSFVPFKELPARAA